MSEFFFNFGGVASITFDTTKIITKASLKRNPPTNSNQAPY